MNIQELKHKMNNVPDHKMHHDVPMNRSMKKGVHHDISTGKSNPKSKALTGAKRIGITEYRADGGKNYLAPGSGLYRNQEEGKAGAERNRRAHIASILAKHKK
jgi:hypothetical protein